MEENLPQNQTQPDNEVQDKMTLIRWHAPSRLFKKRDKVFFQTVIALVILIGLILFLMKEILLIGVVLALAFVAYVLATVPPEEIEYKITVKGFEVAGMGSRWEEFTEFWFEEKWGQKMVVLQKKVGFPVRIIALLGQTDSKLVQGKINEFLPFREVPEKNWVDSAGQWVLHRFSLDKS